MASDINITLLALYNSHDIGIRWLHGYLKARGYNVKSVYFKTSTYFDNLYTQQEFQDLLELLDYTKPDIIGVGVRSPLFPLFKKISEAVRPRCKVIIGGHHATAAPEDCLPYADWVVRGDGEYAMLDILDGKVDGGVVVGKPVMNLSEISPPYYGPGTYELNAQLHLLKISYNTSRGCHFNCSYCHESIMRELYGPCYRRIEPLRVYLDLLSLNEKFGFREFSFGDSIFVQDEDWLEEFVGLVKKHKFLFRVSGNANTTTRKMLQTLKEIGRIFIRFGVQSGSQEIRKKIFNRKDSLEKVLEVASWMDELRMAGVYDFIIENPYDTAQTMKDTRDFIRKFPNGAEIHKFELRWYPGTPLTNRALEEGLIEPTDIDGNFMRLGNWSHSYRNIW